MVELCKCDITSVTSLITRALLMLALRAVLLPGGSWAQLRGAPVSCYEGECARDLAKCAVCTGDACMRYTRTTHGAHSSLFAATVLTCVPFGVDQEEGCRETPRHGKNDASTLCICRQNFCNRAPGAQRAASTLPLLLLIATTAACLCSLRLTR